MTLSSRLFLLLLLAAASSGSAFARDWSGDYQSASFIGLFLHVDIAHVAGQSAHGLHTFTYGTSQGSFAWAATLAPVDDTHATLSGQGEIFNLGVRTFKLSGGLFLDSANQEIPTLFWNGLDPLFGDIGGGGTLVPEPGPLALAALGVVGLAGMLRRRAAQ